MQRRAAGFIKEGREEKNETSQIRHATVTKCEIPSILRGKQEKPFFETLYTIHVLFVEVKRDLGTS